MIGTLYDAPMPTLTPKRPILSVLAVLSIATALVGGCSSSKQSTAPLPDAATLLRESTQTTKAVKSVHLVLSVSGTIKGLPIKTLTGDLSTSPRPKPIPSPASSRSTRCST